MFGSCQVLNTLVPILFTSLPLIGTLLLLHSQSRRRKLEKDENIAACLIFLGFLLFITWEGYYVAAIVGAVGFIGVFIYSRIRKRHLSHIFKEGNMREKYKQLFRYSRLIVKPVGFIFASVGIIMFVLQVLQATGNTVGKEGLVILVIGAALWLLDILWSTLDGWAELSKEIKEHRQSSK